MGGSVRVSLRAVGVCVHARHATTFCVGSWYVAPRIFPFGKRSASGNLDDLQVRCSIRLGWVLLCRECLRLQVLRVWALQEAAVRTDLWLLAPMSRSRRHPATCTFFSCGR